jgi:hypothetical protein
MPSTSKMSRRARIKLSESIVTTSAVSPTKLAGSRATQPWHPTACAGLRAHVCVPAHRARASVACVLASLRAHCSGGVEMVV